MIKCPIGHVWENLLFPPLLFVFSSVFLFFSSMFVLMAAWLRWAAERGLQGRIKLQVKVNCRSLSASLCLRAATLVTLCASEVLRRRNADFYSSYLHLHDLEKTPKEDFFSLCKISTCGFRWRRRCAGTGSFPPSFPRSDGDEAVAWTRCAALPCPVLKRIYWDAAALTSGSSRRREEARKPKRWELERMMNFFFLASFNLQLEGAARKLLKLRCDARRLDSQIMHGD